jgi:hypothetical protein
MNELSPEASADLLKYVRDMADKDCRCDEADMHDEAIQILERHGLKETEK